MWNRIIRGVLDFTVDCGEIQQELGEPRSPCGDSDSVEKAGCRRKLSLNDDAEYHTGDSHVRDFYRHQEEFVFGHGKPEAVLSGVSRNTRRDYKTEWKHWCILHMWRFGNADKRMYSEMGRCNRGLQILGLQASTVRWGNFGD